MGEMDELEAEKTNEDDEDGDSKAVVVELVDKEDDEDDEPIKEEGESEALDDEKGEVAESRYETIFGIEIRKHP
jgi:hypothetical protein